MGSECNTNKPHYDITMSKRTRKAPSNLEKAVSQFPLIGCFPERENSRKVANIAEDDEIIEEKSSSADAEGGPEEKSFVGIGDDEGEHDQENHKISLKALIGGGGGRSSLGQHFTEEEKEIKQLQLVVKQPKDAGLEFKKMAGRCAKILGRLIKIKGSRKNRALSLDYVINH